MGLPQYSPAFSDDDDSSDNVRGGQVVMDREDYGLDDDGLDAFRARCVEHEAALFKYAAAGPSRPYERRATRDYDEGDGSESDIFYGSLK